MSESSPTASIPASLPVFGLSLPVDVALTGRVAAAPAAMAPSCAHTRQVIKRGDTFLVSHTDGEVHPGCECGQGLYFRDTRFLSGMRLSLAGQAPIILSADAEHGFFSRIEAMNEAWISPDGQTVKRETLHLGRTRVVDGGLRERLELTNFNGYPLRLTLSLELRADFKDIFEVRRFMARRATGTFLHPRAIEGGAELLYRGADGQVRHTRIRPDAAPDRVQFRTWAETHETGVVLEWDLALPARGGAWSLELQLAPMIEGVGHDRPDAPISSGHLERLQAEGEAGRTRIATAHPGFQAFVDRGLADLAMLMTPTASGPFPTAGTPWYACPFGRDGLITALQCLPLGPETAVATLAHLAAHQGTRVDPFRDEEPGKIFHEQREGELAALGEVPHTPYYGTIDATPLWLVLLSETWRWTGDLSMVRALWPNAIAALAWIDDYGDADGDGFVEYRRKGDRGLVNQGWKDSHDSVVHPDGTLAEPAIALAEVQGYVYDAKRRMAELARALGDAPMAGRLEAEAAALKARFEAAFWLEEEGFYALALDGQKRPVRTKTSNPGHCLWSGLIDGPRAEAVAKGLLAPDMFNGWGIRTMSAEAPPYQPISYHNGTVWPHDTALVAKGLADRGFKAEVETVVTGLYEASRHFEHHRLPELFCGFARDGRFAKPVPYPVACSPQAWAAGTPFMLLQAALGLEADAPAGVLRLRRPHLPAWLGEVTITGLRVGQATVDLRIDFAEGRTRATVLAQQGELRVEVIG